MKEGLNEFILDTDESKQKKNKTKKQEQRQQTKIFQNKVFNSSYFLLGQSPGSSSSR